MKLLLRILGVAAVLLGAVWALQGLGWGPPGPMSGQVKWGFVGAGLAVAGGVLLILGRTRR